MFPSVAWHRRTITWAWLLACAACGGSDGPSGPADEDLSFLVGAWEAAVFRMTSQQNQSLRVDVLESGASFTLTVEASGSYVAELAALGQTNIERGSIRRSGGRLTLSPLSPPGPSETVDWRFVGETLVLEGASEFDFNLDLLPEPAFAYIELVRR